MNKLSKRRLTGGGAIRLLVAAFSMFALLPAMSLPASAAGNATITVNTFLDDGATPLPFVRVQITDSNGAIYGPRETLPSSGNVSFTVDTVDDSTTFSILAETPPACGIAPDPVDVGPLVEGEEVSVDLLIPFASDCDLGSISVYSYSCPDGINPESTDYAVFRDNCLSTIDGKGFTVSDGGQQWSLSTGAYGISGRAPLIGLVPGTYSITEDSQAAETETVVFCLLFAGAPGSSGDLPSVQQLEVDGQSVDLGLNGERIACDFFAVPSGSPAEEEPVDDDEVVEEEPTAEIPVEDDEEVAEGGEDVGDATLVVHLSVCEVGYSGDDLFGDCHDNGIEGRVITLEGPDGFFDDQVTTLPNTPGPGVARFEDLYGGEYKVSEDIPGDTATYYAYCSYEESDETVDFSYDDSTAEAIILTIGESRNVICDFYIVPDDQGGPEEPLDLGKITVTKYTCPVGYDSEAYGDLSADCTDKTDGIAFTLTPLSGGDSVTKSSGSSGSGRVRFTELEAGDWELYEDVPQEFSNSAVWCNLGGGEWYQKVVSDVNTTVFAVEDGDDIRCSWYNLPEDLSGGGSLRIHKSICPAGLTSGYFTNCYEDTLADVTFIADGPGDFEQTLVTGANGTVTFEDLNAGNYTITEIPPDGVNTAVYVVVCTRDGNNHDFTYDDSSGLRITINIPAGANVVCDWYNVPPKKEEPGATGSVTVIKFLCEGRTDNKYNWDEDCESYGSGAEFDLTRVSNGVILSGVTGNNGRLVFSGLANGAYALDETTGSWCHAEADHVDANGNVLVQSGGDTGVYVYNCGKKDVNTLPSTGTGPAAPTTLASVSMLWGGVAIASLFGLRRMQTRRPVQAEARKAA